MVLWLCFKKNSYFLEMHTKVFKDKMIQCLGFASKKSSVCVVGGGVSGDTHDER